MDIEINEDTIVDIDFDSFGVPKAPKSDKIALIDADTVIFTACLRAEYMEELLPKEFYDDAVYSMLIKHPYYDAEKHAIAKLNEEVAIAEIKSKLERIMDRTGCESYELYLTWGRDNFRYHIHKDYKANRATVRVPPGLNQMKMWAVNKMGARLCDKWEADDEVVYLKKKHPDRFLLCAIDKDVLNSVPGKHFNYYESSKFNIDMKWVETEQEDARLWLYKQCIMGDDSDNIKGCKGIGPKKVEKFIKPGMTDDELWQGVVAAYKSVGRTALDAAINMNLVNMHLLVEEDGELRIKQWLP